MDVVDHLGPDGAVRAALEFPAADSPHPAGRGEKRLLAREALFRELSFGDVERHRVKPDDAAVLPVRQEFALEIMHAAVGSGAAAIE